MDIRPNYVWVVNSLVVGKLQLARSLFPRVPLG